VRQPDPRVLNLRVNGESRTLLVAPQQTLLDALRVTLGLTGSKNGCDMGDCGACTVLVDDVPQLSCITLAAEMEGCAVETVEGAPPSPIHLAFDEQVAAQCGYCTPGFVIALTGLFRENPKASEDEILHCLGANICRCTGYTKIIAAALQAQALLLEESP
jgi:aerobic-type carbon monoxide dehydrogenase small subunit (CoxS/CutS family)